MKLIKNMGIATLILLLLTNPLIAAQEEVKLAAVFAKTGKGADASKAFIAAIRFAVNELNEQGGLLGKKIKLIEFDNKSTALGSIIAAIQSVDSGVPAVIGAMWSSNSLAMAPILQNAKVVMISPSATNPKVTLVGDYIFRVGFIDSFQGLAIADFSVKDLKAKTAAVYVNASEDYSIELADIFIKRFKHNNGKILWKGNYLGNEVDFENPLKIIKQFKPDVTFIPGYPGDVSLIIKQAKKVGLSTIFLGGDGWSNEMYKYAGEELNGNYFSTHWHRDVPFEASKKLLEKFEKKHGRVYRAAIPLGYDAVMLLADAVKRADSTKPERIRTALAHTKNYQGVTGNISFDKNGDPKKPVVILKFDNGTSVFVKSVDPVDTE